jgi:hypothetical protein
VNSRSDCQVIGEDYQVTLDVILMML